jgi:hypothetical protein
MYRIYICRIIISYFRRGVFFSFMVFGCWYFSAYFTDRRRCLVTYPFGVAVNETKINHQTRVIAYISLLKDTFVLYAITYSSIIMMTPVVRSIFDESGQAMSHLLT